MVRRGTLLTMLLMLLIAAAFVGTAWFSVSAADGSRTASQSPARTAAALQSSISTDVSPGDRNRAATVESPATTGRVVVRVYQAPNVAVAGVKVLLAEREVGVTEDQGEVAAVVPAGSYRVAVDPASLPPGLVAPYGQDQVFDFATPDGFYGRVAKVEPGARVQVAVRVFAASTLTGVVVDQHGNGVDGCAIRVDMRSGRGLQGVCFDAVSDHSGMFRIEGVLPGGYVLKAMLVGHTVPTPQRIEVPEGRTMPLDPLVIDGGKGVIRGRLVDQDGKGVAGLQVLCYPANLSTPAGETGVGLADIVCTATTAASGAFVMERLPAGTLVVQAHPEGSLERMGSATRLTRPITPVTVRIDGDETHDVGNLVGEFSRPFLLELTIVNNEAAIRAVDPALRHVSPPMVSVVDESLLAEPFAAQKHSLRPDKANDSLYRHACETPHEPVYLILQRPNFAPRQLRLEPTCGVHRVEIRYPD